MSTEPDQVATKADLRDLREWIMEREFKAIRWFVILQLSYFSITVASVWFMVSQLNGQLLARINELIEHLK